MKNNQIYQLGNANDTVILYAQWEEIFSSGAGLYDSNNNIIKTWSELEALGLTASTVEYDYKASTAKTTAWSPYKVFNDNSLSGILVLPSGITKICNYAFYQNPGLTGIIIPNSVTRMGNYAFRECSGLATVMIGSGVTSIGRGAFLACSKLTSATFDDPN